MANQVIELAELTDADSSNLIGSGDRNLKAISEYFAQEISYRSGKFTLVNGTPEVREQVQEVLQALLTLAHQHRVIQEQDVIYACRLVSRHEPVSFEEYGQHLIGRTLTGRAVAPKTRGQLAFARAMENHDIVFAIGPAGTGKTYLAVVQAVSALKKGTVKRIILTRPAVEAGESLGFLPGDLKEKVDPYLTPLYDALHDMLGSEQTDRLIEKGTIEIAPLAYMRGRTLDDAYIILDEAQNTTRAQMQMFLTRLGFASRMIITGDITQIDLARGAQSGLVHAAAILKDIPEIEIVQLTSDDVVRHPLVQKIIDRYAADAQGLPNCSKR